jgi:ATP-dependent DNA ligase
VTHTCAVPLPRLERMLATNRVQRVSGAWAVEPKLDGWRALVYVDEKVTVRARSGRDVSASVPELLSCNVIACVTYVFYEVELMCGT